MTVEMTGVESGAGVTLLIASPALLRVWSEHAARANTIVGIADSDLSHVIDVVRVRRPPEVVLEETLAGSPRGGPLMCALREQHRVRGLTIRVLSPARVAELSSSHPGHTSAHIWLTAFAHPLPARPRQRAPRVRLNGHDEILIDRQPARLLDISSIGAQVASQRALLPHQHVRVVLAASNEPAAVAARIVWSAFELAPVPEYRAGLAFSASVPYAVQKFAVAGGGTEIP
jgi:hypothetical protein